MNTPSTKATWIPLKDFNGYEISSTAPHVIRKTGTDKLQVQSISNSGYYQVTIDGHTHPMHRIIAEQFLLNPEHLTDVNHINHNKTDNRISNLEWISHAQNLSHRKVFKKQKSEYITTINPETTIAAAADEPFASGCCPCSLFAS